MGTKNSMYVSKSHFLVFVAFVRASIFLVVFKSKQHFSHAWPQIRFLSVRVTGFITRMFASGLQKHNQSLRPSDDVLEFFEETFENPQWKKVKEMKLQ